MEMDHCSHSLYLQDNVVPPTDAKIIEGYLKASGHGAENGSAQSHAQERVVEHYIVPGAGHQVMIVNSELVNPVITEFLIKKCGLETLSGAWQILNKTAGENKWDLKNYEKVGVVLGEQFLMLVLTFAARISVEARRYYLVHKHRTFVVQSDESNATNRPRSLSLSIHSQPPRNRLHHRHIERQ